MRNKSIFGLLALCCVLFFYQNCSGSSKIGQEFIQASGNGDAYEGIEPDVPDQDAEHLPDFDPDTCADCTPEFPEIICQPTNSSSSWTDLEFYRYNSFFVLTAALPAGPKTEYFRWKPTNQETEYPLHFNFSENLTVLSVILDPVAVSARVYSLDSSNEQTLEYFECTKNL